MTTQARATNTSTDELAATIAAMKSRLNELEVATGGGGAPIGTIVDYIGSTAPKGWALLDGTTITNGALLYPNLWAVLPASFKSGNAIVLPDTRGRVTVHQAAAGTLATGVGTTGGAETVTLSSSQMPVHDHTISHTHTLSHTHTYSRSDEQGQIFVQYPPAGIGPLVQDMAFSTQTTSGASNATTSSPSSSNSGSAGGTGGVTQAHQNLQPYMVTVKIMKLR